MSCAACVCQIPARPIPVSTLTCTGVHFLDATDSAPSASASSKEESVRVSPNESACGYSSANAGESSKMSACGPISRRRAASSTFATAK